MELGIDLQYLLFLQNLRLATGGIFDEFLNGMSKVAVDVLPFLPFLIFLCVDKKWGYRFLTLIPYLIMKSARESQQQTAA